MLVLGGDFQVVDLVLLENVEERLVAADLDRPQLIVIPMVLEDILHINLTLPADILHMQISAIGAYENAVPDEAVRSLVFLAINTIFIIRILLLLFQECR